MNDQLDLFRDSPQRGDGSGDRATVEADSTSGGFVQAPRSIQLSELPGETFEDIFGDAA